MIYSASLEMFLEMIYSEVFLAGAEAVAGGEVPVREAVISG